MVCMVEAKKRNPCANLRTKNQLTGVDGIFGRASEGGLGTILLVNLDIGFFDIRK